LRIEKVETATSLPAFLSQFSILNSQFPRVILFGGKGGVGKTTISALAALHFSATRPVRLFTSDPASNLGDIFGTDPQPNLVIEQLDANALYRRFLEKNLPSFIELGDRGTYLDRSELARLFELSLPGIDELMAWMRIGELAEEDDSLLIVDTAPTGHTLRMLSASGHFHQLASALESMQSKHRVLVEQLTRRRLVDSLDDFLRDFDRQIERRLRLLRDPAVASFVPVFLAQPWVVAQTARLAHDVEESGIRVRFCIMNQSRHDPSCSDHELEAARELAAVAELAPREIVTVPRACAPIDTAESLRAYLKGKGVEASVDSIAGIHLESRALQPRRIHFIAGKGGVGKTTVACSIAMQRAATHPLKRFVLISVDPAHTVKDVFANEKPPANIVIETIDTRELWIAFRERFSTEVSRAIDGLTPRGFSLDHDQAVIGKLLDIAPPGADELFAIMRLADLVEDPAVDEVFVDTAPTGHFLRLLDLPRTAGEWVRELMRILLKYRELVPIGGLGEELLSASKALHQFETTLRSEGAGVLIVTRADRIVVAETLRLLDEVKRRDMRVDAVIVNALTPESSCRCDQQRRQHEERILGSLPFVTSTIMLRPDPPVTLDDLRDLVALRQDETR